MSTLPKLLLSMVCCGVLSVATPGLAAAPVPTPWTPVGVKSAEAATEVTVWGRTHRFLRSPLPASIRTAGQELLAAPIRLVGTVDGKPAAWSRSGVFALRHGPEQATLTGWLANDAVIIDSTVRMDFDGMARVDLVVLPQRGAKPRVDQLWLEIPLKSSCATLYHCWPGRWGRAENSGAVGSEPKSLPFKALVWLGWEEGGLSWFAESDQGWQPQRRDQAIEVIPGAETTVLRVRLLDSAPPRLPLTFTFGLQATPVKPWPADFHEWRIWHAPQLATTLGKSASVVFPKWFTCHRAFPDGKPLPKLDRAAELGVKTVVFHEDWNPVQNYPATSEEPQIKSLVDACHQRGMKVLLYFGYEFSPLAPEWAEMADDVLLKNAKGVAYPGWHRLPEQRDFRVCYHSRYQDLLVDGIKRLMDRIGFDGVYLDGTISPEGCCNQHHGCGYQAPDGTLRPTYPIFAVRQLMQRLYTMIHPRGGLVNAHQSTCCMTPTLAFVHSYWDGEQFAGGELSGDPLSRLPLGAFRAEFMGRNFGVPCEFLAYERPPKWMFDDALAFTMLHDVRVRPHGSGRLLEQMSQIWDVMTRFGVSTAQWQPYWKNAQFVSTQPDTVKVSLYSQPSRVLAVVANLSSTEAKAAQVQLDSSRLGLPASVKAKDALSGEALNFAGGRLTVPLAPMRMRLVWVE
jgi:hypothetical protein